jgi:hypothetical protein
MEQREKKEEEYCYSYRNRGNHRKYREEEWKNGSRGDRGESERKGSI